LASVTTIVAFVASYVATGTLHAALGVIGFCLLILIPFYLALPLSFLLYFRKWNRRILAATLFMFGLAVLFAVGDILFLPIPSAHELHEMGVFQFLGILVLLAVGVSQIDVAYTSYKRRRRCPECMNFVHGEARLCHYCGFRWKAPLE
jgi:hypothetical protein